MQKKVILIFLWAATLFSIVGFFIILRENTKPQNRQVYHVGILNALDHFSSSTIGFKSALFQFGYIEGVNIFYDEVKAPTPVGNSAIIQKFVDEHVDLIFAFPTEASLEAKKGVEGSGIPVIFADVVIDGNTVVDSVKHSSANITGVNFPGIIMAKKRLELLHQIAPSSKNILVPYMKDYPTVPPIMSALQSVADKMQVTLIEAPFSTIDELTQFLEDASSSKKLSFDAILGIPEPFDVTNSVGDIIDAFASSHKLPTASWHIGETASGPIVGVVSDAFAGGELAGRQAHSVLEGIRAGDIPVLNPEIEISINYLAIKRLGLTVSDVVLAQASHITY